MNKRVLIFGSGGFVGKYLTKEFKSGDYEVYGSDIIENNSVDLCGFYKCDLLDKERVENTVLQIDPSYIVNLAAVSSVGLSWRIPQKTLAVNTEGTINIFEAARKLDSFPKILLIGSSEEYLKSDTAIKEDFPLDSGNPYGISKITQERFAELYRSRYGLNIYCVRAFNHTGVGQADSFVIPNWCKQAADISKSGHTGTINVGNISLKRDFTDVRDIVRAYRMVIESGDCSKVYNIGCGKAYELKEILDYIISLSDEEIKINIDRQLFRPNDNPVIYCDNSLISKALGWKAKYDIFDTVKEIFDYYIKSEKAIK